MIESPIVNDSITNKQAKESIYHTCRSVLNALQYIEGFQVYMEDVDTETDPLTKLWHICRQGASLCYLYNTLKPNTPILLNTKSSSVANKSKAYAYHFIIACRDQLQFPENTLFTVTELFQNDTNKLVKVVNTVKRILDLLEKEGIIQVKNETATIQTTDTPKDMRDNVVVELISTERKYVQDLESLQNYMKEVSAQDILSQDTMHYLFGNLNALVDFQRRFLIRMEEQVAHTPKEQRFGRLFIQFEEAFSVYEPFCANFQIAQDLVIQEAPKLQKLVHIMSPIYELPAMLIKPIQRVCKYPLLIQQLLKSTPENWPYTEEIKLGLEAIQRITKKVNETKRIQENLLLVQGLRKRIVDDTHLILDSSGQLLLHDKFSVQKKDSDTVREMQVYLFEKIVLICKEIKDVNKNTITTITKKKRKEGSLIIRGKILLSRVEHVKGSSTQNGNYTLHLSWMENDMQTILLKCRNDEHLRQWLDVIIDLKKTSNKLDLFSPPHQSLLHHYDEDEEDYYDGNPSEDEEHSSSSSSNGNSSSIPSFMRNRSYSYQYQQNRFPEVTSRKSSFSHHPITTTARHFMNGVPGMSLPPLPRSPTTNVPTLSNASVSTVHSTESALYSPISFPSSPTNLSYPPSPTSTTTPAMTTTSSRASCIISHGSLLKNEPSGTLWQRRQSHKPSTTLLDQRHLIEGQNEEDPIPLRLRSQSSPNIQRPLPSNIADMPLLPPQYYERRNSYKYDEKITKLKVHYFGAVYIVVVPNDIGYAELQKRIESKIKLCGGTTLGLKYEDEDGDLITISSSEDVQMGFESKGPNNSVNLYVT